ncbi:MAG: hypothetical protein AAGF12_35360 [Myxococcota bacterium]
MAKASPNAFKKKAGVRPLLVRPGARYTCFGDGLCCTDLHGLGPLTKKEVKALRVISEDVVADADESGFDEPMLQIRNDGGCLFLGEGRCELHAALGPDAKPEGCRRFPLGLAATPTGGRITTRHRCPCRTLGDRPPLDPAAAAPSLTTGGKLRADRRVGVKVQLEENRKVSFEEYLEIESQMLTRLRRGDDPAEVLAADPFPELEEDGWKKKARKMFKSADESRFGAAIQWFARSVDVLVTSKEQRTPDPLRWDEAFDRAEARAPEEELGEDVIADWISDEIWSLQWTESGSFARARADLATRYAVAADIRQRLEHEGRRPDRAAAEAVAVVDLIGDSEWWEDILPIMEIDAP